MQSEDTWPAATPSAALLIQSDRLPCVLEPIDGETTGLNAIGFAIVEAGFTGVRVSYVGRECISWQWRLNAPEGVYFACLHERAKRGLSLPSVEQVLEIIRPFAEPDEGQKK